ncbi:MAG: hypothetical protein HW391_1951 [Chloroflexi bacterium]|nr:hypothetical protein [Chloroflexota bacterium]
MEVLTVARRRAPGNLDGQSGALAFMRRYPPVQSAGGYDGDGEAPLKSGIVRG